MVEEATIDCYGEEEQLTGFATMIGENLELPFTTRIFGFAVTVTGVTHTSHGLVANCVYDQHAQAIHVLDLPMPEPPPKGAEWIAPASRSRGDDASGKPRSGAGRLTGRTVRKQPAAGRSPHDRT